MPEIQTTIDVYLEIGVKRAFAGAVDWPGWCRSGKDEETALQELFAYGPRYARVLQNARIEFLSPTGPSAFNVVERLPGSTTTDFGAPDASPAYDSRHVDDPALHRLQALLQASWQALDVITHLAAGKELRLGPRGGGRPLDKILWHVLNAEAAYLSQLGGKVRVDEMGSLVDEFARVRQAVLDTLTQSAHGELPARGPRGGLRWTPWYFVRRTTWHVLDHAWEIEDRMVE
jgi:hypothetical protein